jgi:hypothetical protein
MKILITPTAVSIDMHDTGWTWIHGWTGGGVHVRTAALPDATQLCGATTTTLVQAERRLRTPRSSHSSSWFHLGQNTIERKRSRTNGCGIDWSTYLAGGTASLHYVGGRTALFLSAGHGGVGKTKRQNEAGKTKGTCVLPNTVTSRTVGDGREEFA